MLTALGLQEQVTLLEYSMNAATEGIDAVAYTRVVIRGEYPHSVTHPQTGKLVQRSCRFVSVNKIYRDLFCSEGSEFGACLILPSFLFLYHVN